VGVSLHRIIWEGEDCWLIISPSSSTN